MWGSSQYFYKSQKLPIENSLLLMKPLTSKYFLKRSNVSREFSYTLGNNVAELSD